MPYHPLIFMEWDKYACNFQSMKVKKNPKNIHLGSKIDQFRQFWDIFEEEIFFLSFLRWPEGPCTIFANYFSNAIFCLAFTNCYSFLSYLERKKWRKKLKQRKKNRGYLFLTQKEAKLRGDLDLLRSLGFFKSRLDSQNF